MTLKVKHNELQSIIQKSEKVNQPLHVDGAVGIGKSEVTRETAQELATNKELEFVDWNDSTQEQKQEIRESPEDYYVFMDIRLSQYDPSDIKGLPDLQGDKAVWKLFEWGDFITNQDAQGMIFFDEVNLAEPTVQTAFYQLILKHEISERKVSDGFYVMAAGNRAGKDRARVHEMPAPLRDRFSRLELKSPRAGSGGDWTEWAMDAGLDERVIGFLSSPSFEGYLNNFAERKDEKVFATPRSWAKVSEMIRNVEDREQVKTLASTMVGEGIATEFKGFLDMREKADVQEIRENPEMIKEYTGRGDIDVKYSVMSGLAGIYREDAQALSNLVEVAGHLHDANDTEFAILMLKMASNYKSTHFRNNIVEEERFVEDLIEPFDDYINIDRGDD